MPQQKAIWDPGHGITGLGEADLEDLRASEIPGIRAVWADQQKRLKGSAQLSEFTERLGREWAIETGVIENLYEIERGVTQTLIERGFLSELFNHGSTNKPREYVLKLLRDQQAALDGVFDFVKSERDLSTSYVKELHAALLRSQNTTEGLDAHGNHINITLNKGEWKRQENYPLRDGVIYTYCPPEHVSAEMDRLIEMYKDHADKGVSGEVQAAWLHHRFTQIHPFQDGNGRVARALASLVLVKDGLFPLVVTRTDKSDYLNALEAADDGDLKPLIDLFVKLQIIQFRKASAISENILAKEDTRKAALDLLLHAADRRAHADKSEKRGVLDHAQALEDDLEEWLKEIVPDVETALKKVLDTADVFVSRSGENTNHYYRAQIVENAKNHLEYFADIREYCSWVALKMKWSRRCQLVFAIHGIGKPFNGSLICAPFLEFRDVDEDGQTHATFVPVAKEGFVFFYNEDRSKLLSRFRPWRENVFKVAVYELIRNI